ncbi:GNAT family N-acetyltransferase [Kitasatospora sp. MBT66]|uniref:GNAT family N-acetyltransferase n=1 Tax=Kitasatospora sp. MBT66 TaxID=1444769 RepID=UPI0007C72CBB|nr:GNAT family N-acetyltransferase [Kitasatospora sp. MBT66]
MIDLRFLTPADPDDWPLWRDARLAALRDAPHAFKVRLSDWPTGGEEEWRARFARRDAVHVVAVSADGRPVGLAGGIPSPGRDGAAELRSLWVGPEARGRRTGDRLLAAVEAWARRTGRTSLRLAVLAGNAPAEALYRRNGFTDADEPDAPCAPSTPDRSVGGGVPGAERAFGERVMVKRLVPVVPER